MTLDIQRTIRTLETVFPKARIALPERLTPGWLAQCEIRIRDSDEHGLREDVFVHRVTVLQEPDQLAACGWFEANPGGTADRPKDDLRISNHDELTGWVSWVRGKLPKHDVASWEPDKATFPMPNTQALAWHLAGTTSPSVKNGGFEKIRHNEVILTTGSVHIKEPNGHVEPSIAVELYRPGDSRTPLGHIITTLGFRAVKEHTQSIQVQIEDLAGKVLQAHGIKVVDPSCGWDEMPIPTLPSRIETCSPDHRVHNPVQLDKRTPAHRVIGHLHLNLAGTTHERLDLDILAPEETQQPIRLRN